MFIRDENCVIHNDVNIHKATSIVLIYVKKCTFIILVIKTSYCYIIS